MKDNMGELSRKPTEKEMQEAREHCIDRINKADAVFLVCGKMVDDTNIQVAPVIFGSKEQIGTAIQVVLKNDPVSRKILIEEIERYTKTIN